MKKQSILCFALCFLLILSGCSEYSVGQMLPDEWYAEKGENGEFKNTRYYNYFLNDLGLGFFEVYKLGNGTIDEKIGVYCDKPNTHLKMLLLKEGMTVPELVAACGEPDGMSYGLVQLHYQMADGTKYTLRFDDQSFTLKYWGVELPNGSILDKDDVVAFQWKVRLVYLGIAAVLGGVLVALIKVPNTIRKRKTKPATE